MHERGVIPQMVRKSPGTTSTASVKKPPASGLAQKGDVVVMVSGALCRAAPPTLPPDQCCNIKRDIIVLIKTPLCGVFLSAVNYFSQNATAIRSLFS
ncbi:hypothetical protein M8494_12815 [Serratia ureilytica]